MVFVRSYMLI
jgi:hypothetical protein